MRHPHCEASDPDDDCARLPSVEALTAGTLALMTCYAQAPADGPNRSLMARKLVSNLFFLSGHPHVSPPMRAMAANLRKRWQLSLEDALVQEVPPEPTPLWHRVAGGVH
jgi:hypothetical protein